MKVGFIGLGNMGNHMARHILEAGYELYVYDIRKEAAKNLLDKGATWVETPKAMAKVCQVILSSLPGPPEVEDVVYGKNGLISAWKKGNIYIDMSTNSPTTVRKIAKDARAIGVEVLDAPVSGAVAGAEAGTLTIMVGGNADILGKVRDILQTMGKNIFHVGDIGCGNIAKLANNAMAFSALAVDTEAFALGVKAGIDPTTLFEIVRLSTGNNSSLERYYRTITTENFEPGFRLSLAAKDIRLALDLAREYNVPLRVATAVAQQIFEAEASGLGEKGIQALILQLEKATGMRVRQSKQ